MHLFRYFCAYFYNPPLHHKCKGTAIIQSWRKQFTHTLFSWLQPCKHNEVLSAVIIASLGASLGLPVSRTSCLGSRTSCLGQTLLQAIFSGGYSCVCVWAVHCLRVPIPFHAGGRQTHVMLVSHSTNGVMEYSRAVLWCQESSEVVLVGRLLKQMWFSQQVGECHCRSHIVLSRLLVAWQPLC